MNQTELLHYLSQCLAEEHHRAPNHADHLATALATRLLATQGLDARLSQDDLIALDRKWGHSNLGERVANVIRQRRHSEPAPENIVGQGFLAAAQFRRTVTGQDVEQAARVRWLGVTTFAQLRQQHLEYYDNFLLVIHKTYGRSSRDAERSIAELREIASSKPKDQCGLDIVTRSRHMSHLSALLTDMRATEELEPQQRCHRVVGCQQGGEAGFVLR